MPISLFSADLNNLNLNNPPASKPMATKDAWNSEQYQQAAGFVPKLATKIIDWLDLKTSDRILDIGCGDGVITATFTNKVFMFGADFVHLGGSVRGIDASPSMIATAKANIQKETERTGITNTNLNYEVWDCSKGLPTPFMTLPTKVDGIQGGRMIGYNWLFSNAALHWIIKPSNSDVFFQSANRLCLADGKFVFEMGGRGNIAEFHAALLMAVARRIGITAARRADPWFFPSETWIRTQLEKHGFKVEKMETEYRPTKAEKGPGGGIEGWVRLMGKAFLEAVDVGVRDEVVKEVVEALETVVGGEGDGEATLGYVRLRCKARKVRCV